MSISAVKPVSCLAAPANPANGSKPRLHLLSSTKSLPSLQKKETEKLSLKENSMSSTTRRGMIQFTALSLAGLAAALISSPLEAEAGPQDAAVKGKEKVTNKLEELKEKAKDSLSMSKDVIQDKTPTPKDLTEEMKKKNRDDRDRDMRVEPRDDAAISLPQTSSQDRPLVPTLPNIKDKVEEAVKSPRT
uniref:Early dehydration-responsive 1 n=1 Tax=Craterostigma plantagineum TaxID=4153 RepID=A0A097HTL8_CRAPL|nr:early dehydration-responsive 1 [Craterostigma plantagineum]